MHTYACMPLRCRRTVGFNPNCVRSEIEATVINRAGVLLIMSQPLVDTIVAEPTLMSVSANM